MRGLSDTITRLSKLRANGTNPKTVGEHLQSLGQFGSNPGALHGKIHLPRSVQRNPPLVVVLHGCTQTADAYDTGSGWSRLADDHGFIVLYPQQSRANNPNLCFNWFQPGDVRRGEGEAHSIAQMIEHVVDRYQVDKGRVFITGLSAGGAMGNVMLAAYPEMFAAGALIAGLPYGVANSVPQAFDCMRGHGIRDVGHLQLLLRDASPHRETWPSISIWHGTADQTVDVANARAIAQQWMAAHAVDILSSTLEEGRGYSLQSWADASGEPAIELYTIPGMAHGTPIDAGRGYGRPAPFMLDQGVSSTEMIADRWGLTDGERVREEAFEAAHPHAFPQMMGAPEIHPPVSGIQKTIEDALRAAGLMP